MGVDIYSDEPVIGFCSKCGEARDADYTCRNGGSTVPEQPFTFSSPDGPEVSAARGSGDGLESPAPSTSGQTGSTTRAAWAPPENDHPARVIICSATGDWVEWEKSTPPEAGDCPHGECACRPTLYRVCEAA